jgi:hypothetical protein
VELKSFKTLCYAAAIAVQGKVIEFQEADASRNFHRLLMEMNAPKSCVQVFLNEIYPLIAFAAPTKYTFNLEFIIDVPALSQHFSGARFGNQYRVLSKQELETLFDFANEKSYAHLLLPAEVSQIKYWCPQRVGDIIFNFWD